MSKLCIFASVSNPGSGAYFVESNFTSQEDEKLFGPSVAAQILAKELAITDPLTCVYFGTVDNPAAKTAAWCIRARAKENYNSYFYLERSYDNRFVLNKEYWPWWGSWMDTLFNYETWGWWSGDFYCKSWTDIVAEAARGIPQEFGSGPNVY